MFRKILVPVDFTDKNEAALDSAVQIAAAQGVDAEITLLHVIETIEHIDFKEMKDFYERLELQDAAKLFALEGRLEERGAKVRHQILFGKRAETIVRYAEEMAIDLMVLSSHKVDRDHPALGLGTLGYGIAIVARCPVLLVK
ncbi:MAG TPA: universal stress protein [Thermoanaerobaculia bacterium]|jgi:nucleotide-binding universal stress UspA family protein|nr:universal stress protein [Thermoanaerobaculia bacterium]